MTRTLSRELFARLGEWEVAVARLVERVRPFFYRVVLLSHTCPACEGPLTMIREGVCRCRRCGRSLDPTVAFQRCAACEGGLYLRVRRYACRRCGEEAESRFLFDGQVFNAEYFREKMAESRQRKRRARESAASKALAQRSTELAPGPADLASAPGLIETLNRLTGQPDPEFVAWAREAFDLQRYERHVLRHVGSDPIPLEDLPPLDRHDRLERIRLFVAAVFLAHAGLIATEQYRQTILVSRRETDREGQGIPRDPEPADAEPRSVGGAEA